MAKIELSGIVAGVRGTIGGITYSANKSGAYARNWYRSTNPKSTRQNDARNSLSNWSKLWQTLTSTQRTGWNTYAANAAQAKTDSLGNTYYASGFNWFIAINTNRAMQGNAMTATAPAAAAPGTPVVESFIFRNTGNPNPTVIKFTVGSPPLALDHVITAIVVNSVAFTVPPQKKFFMVCATPDGSREIDFKAELLAKFGTAKVGQRCFVACWALSSEGRAGPIATAQANAI